VSAPEVNLPDPGESKVLVLKVRFKRGDDLSAITYNHYNTPVSSAEISAVNYVQQVASNGSGAILPKRYYCTLILFSFVLTCMGQA
jgi:hypothetical protein